MGQAMAGKLGATLSRPCQEAEDKLDRMIRNHAPGRKHVEIDMFGFVEDDENDSQAEDN